MPQQPYPLKNIDLEDLVKTQRWTTTSAIHTPTFDAALSEQGQTLTFTFASGHKETIGRSDIEALTRYLTENAHVAPLAGNESDLEDIHPRRVDE